VLVKLSDGNLEGTLVTHPEGAGTDQHFAFLIDPAKRPLQARFPDGVTDITNVGSTGFTLVDCARWMPRAHSTSACQFSRAV